jgi:hypothetical protein
MRVRQFVFFLEPALITKHWRSSPAPEGTQICGVNSGLGGDFPETDFLAGLLGSRKDFGGFLLFLLKGVDCGLKSGH